MFAPNTTAITSWRPTCKSVTSELNAPSVADQGTVYVAQFGATDVPVATGRSWTVAPAARLSHPTPMEVDGWDDSSAAAAGPVVQDSPVGYWSWLGGNTPLDGKVLVPSTESVQQSSVLSTVRPAREGAFVIHKLVQAAPAYKGVMANSSAYVFGALPLVGAVLDPSQVLSASDIAIPSDISLAWIYYSGISSQASVTLKVIQGVESIPALGSALCLFSRHPTLPDESALDYVAGQMATAPDSLPAAANDFGDFLRTIATEGAGFLAGLIPGAGPVLGPLARNVVGQVVDGIRGASARPEPLHPLMSQVAVAPQAGMVTAPMRRQIRVVTKLPNPVKRRKQPKKKSHKK